MKKIVSIIAALSLLGSVFTTVSADAGANNTTEPQQDTGYEVLTKIDFDSGNQRAYYQDGSHIYGSALQNPDESEQSSRLKYEMIKPYTWDWHNALLLSNAEGTDVLTTVEYDTLQFSVDIKADIIREGLTEFQIGIAYITDEFAKNLSGSTDYYRWNIVPRRVDIVTINRSELLDNEWHTFTGEFTVPAHNIDEHPYVFLHQEVTIDGTDDWNGNAIYLDNIEIKQPKAEKSGVTDFDSNNQRKFYTLEEIIKGDGVNSEFWQNTTKARGGLKDITEEDPEHGAVYAATSAAQVVNWNRNWEACKAAAVCLGNTMGTARLHPETGDEIYVTAEVKNTKLSDQDIRLGLVFDDYAGNDVGDWVYGLLGHSGRIYQVGQIDMSNTDWQRIGGKVTVPEIDAAAKTPKLVLFTMNTQEISELEIYIDNIIVEETKNVEGDVNRDTETDILDLIAMKKAVSNKKYNIYADIEFDGKINAQDLAKLRKKLLNL